MKPTIVTFPDGKQGIQLDGGVRMEDGEILKDEAYTDSVVDLFVATQGHTAFILADGGHTTSVLNYVTSAKRFRLDAKSTVWLAEMVQENYKLIEELRPFAIVPYPRIMVEADPLIFQWSAHPHMDGVVMLGMTGRKQNIGFYDLQTHRFWTHLELEAVPVFAEFCRLFGMALCLAFIGRRVRIMEEVKGRRTLSKRKLRYFSHSKISIDILSARQLRKAIKVAGTHASPRRHEVMGHFIHRGGQLHGCIHDWVKIEREDQKLRWQCSHCERKRTWRDAFERGDAGKGFVRQQYAVTAEGNR